MKASGPISERELEAAALRYLDRFDSTAKNLTRILLGYVRKVARERGEEAAERGPELVAALVLRYVESGILNDARFADSLATGLRRRGASSRAIRQKLRARGVSDDVSAQALAGVDSEVDGNAEIEAARAFVRRRRLGEYRPEAMRAAYRRKDLAALARAGFDFDTAKAALAQRPDDEDSDF